MAIYFSSLNSGSNGNCFYLANETEAVLIDTGLSCRETEKRMNRLSLSMEKVKAIFISHEHGDHIKGLAVIAKKYRLPIYSNPKTLAGCKDLPLQQIKFLSPLEPVMVGGLAITGFPKLHDAADPCSFVIADAGLQVGVFTDIGAACKNVIHYFKQCQAIFLEANYDEELLENGRYPYALKNRIRGGMGHLSNKQALHLFLTHRNEALQYLLLSHLSKDNNCPNLVKNMFSAQAGKTTIAIAGRFQETALYKIAHPENKLRHSSAANSSMASQLSIF